MTIQEEATYILSGFLTNGQIIVDAESTDKIQLILNGVEINCDTSAAIYVRQADKVFVTLARDTQNVLSNKEDFVQIDDNNIDAVIFSKDDLTLNGLGELVINAAYGHGIVSKDDLVFTGGTYTITAAKNGLCGKDSIRFADGSFKVAAGSDGIHGDNDDDATLGYIYIEGGSFDLTPAEDAINSSNAVYIIGGEIQIEAGDDAIHGDIGVAVVNGNINILGCYEGIEGKQIEISGGNISVAASDDGLNATAGSSSDTAFGGFFGGGRCGFQWNSVSDRWRGIYFRTGRQCKQCGRF